MARAKPKKQRGGKREGAGRKVGSTTKDPRAIMKEMGCKDSWKSPLEFCLAVMNNDPSLNFGLDSKTRRKRRPTIGQMIECARVAAPFVHQKLPEILDVNPSESWAEMIREGEARIKALSEPDEDE
jgi:hypothetical protein